MFLRLGGYVGFVSSGIHQRSNFLGVGDADFYQPRSAVRVLINSFRERRPAPDLISVTSPETGAENLADGFHGFHRAETIAPIFS